MWTSHNAAAVLLAAALAACGCKTDPRPASTPPPATAPDAAAAAQTGAKMERETTIPAEAYRLAAGADGRWAWSTRNHAAVGVDGDKQLGIPGSEPATSLFFAGDALYAGLARLDIRSGQVAAPIGRAQYGAGLSGKPADMIVRNYVVTGGAWSRAGDLVVVALEHRLPKRESAPPKDSPTAPLRRLLAFDAQGTLVADMGRETHPLIAVGAERVFATGGLTISSWKRSDLTKPEKKITAKAGITQLVLSPDESKLAYTWNGGVAGHPGATGNVVVHDIASGADTAAWQADTLVDDVAWHPGGAMVATAGEHGAKVWKLDGSVVLEARAEPATAVAFTPDGTQLLVALAGTAPKVVRVDVP
jgi:hypothetical protein